MKRILGVVCILFSGYVSAQVAHPEDPTVVGVVGGIYGDDVCFDNDGFVDPAACNAGDTNAPGGYVYALNGNWNSQSVGINGCGTLAVDPVSSASCPYVGGTAVDIPFALCTSNEYVLVQTLVSGKYFAIKAGATCGVFNRPESQVIFPCLSTDPFDPVTGCTPAPPNPSPPQISVEDGYIKLDNNIGAPPNEHCVDASHNGRMVVDVGTSNLYVCVEGIWRSTFLEP